jgi:hypothetical protein
MAKPYTLNLDESLQEIVVTLRVDGVPQDWTGWTGVIKVYDETEATLFFTDSVTVADQTTAKGRVSYIVTDDNRDLLERDTTYHIKFTMIRTSDTKESYFPKGGRRPRPFLLKTE